MLTPVSLIFNNINEIKVAVFSLMVTAVLCSVAIVCIRRSDLSNSASLPRRKEQNRNKICRCHKRSCAVACCAVVVMKWKCCRLTQVQKSYLDTELELIAKEKDGGDTRELVRQVAVMKHQVCLLVYESAD